VARAAVAGRAVSRQAEDKQDRDSVWRVFGAMAAVVVMLMAGAYFWVRSLLPTNDWGAFADVYGAVVGTLFSGLAFAGLILTVHLQRRELRATRRELTRTADAQAAQAQTTKRVAQLSALTALLNASTDSRVFDEELQMFTGRDDRTPLKERIQSILSELDLEAVEQ